MFVATYKGIANVCNGMQMTERLITGCSVIASQFCVEPTVLRHFQLKAGCHAFYID